MDLWQTVFPYEKIRKRMQKNVFSLCLSKALVLSFDCLAKFGVRSAAGCCQFQSVSGCQPPWWSSHLLMVTTGRHAVGAGSQHATSRWRGDGVCSARRNAVVFLIWLEHFWERCLSRFQKVWPWAEPTSDRFSVREGKFPSLTSSEEELWGVAVINSRFIIIIIPFFHSAFMRSNFSDK